MKPQATAHVPNRSPVSRCLRRTSSICGGREQPEELGQRPDPQPFGRGLEQGPRNRRNIEDVVLHKPAAESLLRDQLGQTTILVGDQ